LYRKQVRGKINVEKKSCRERKPICKEIKKKVKINDPRKK